MQNNPPPPCGKHRILEYRLSVFSILIGAYLFILPVVAVTLLFVVGIGVSLAAGKMNEDAGGWLIVFAVIFAGPVAAVIYLLEAVAGAALGGICLAKRDEGRWLPILGILLNAGAILGNLLLFLSVFLWLTAYPR